MSEFYQTPAYPPGAGPDFVNAAFAMESALPVRDILKLLHRIEAEMGRERRERWGQRTLDLDLIAHGDQVIPDAQTVQRWIDLPLDQQMQQAPEELLLPHPRLQDRAFVLVPLMDIAAQWRHPVLGKTIRQLHDALPIEDKESVNLLVNRAIRS